MSTFLIPVLFLLAPTTGTGGEEAAVEEAAAPGFSLKSLAQLDMIDSLRVGGLLRGSFDYADEELSAVSNEYVRSSITGSPAAAAQVRISWAMVWRSHTKRVVATHVSPIAPEMPHRRSVFSTRRENTS